MDFSLVFLLLSMMYAPSSSTTTQDVMAGNKDWNTIFNSVSDESKALSTMDKAMEKKISESLGRSERTMMKSKRKATYITINQDVHLGRADEHVMIQKFDLMDRLRKIAQQYPWVSLRKMTVVWKTGVSNNVKWDVKMSFLDRRDNNEETKELFMMEFPVCDNFIMMMSPGYTAYMAPSKGRLPWRFDFDFPDGEFSSATIFGTLKIKLEIDQYREATQVPEIVPMVKFTRVQQAVEEPTIRWMSKGRWYQSSATSPEPLPLATIQSAMEDMRMKYDKFLAFLKFDPTKLDKAAVLTKVWGLIDPNDLALFERNPIELAKSFSSYHAKYKQLISQVLQSSVQVPYN
ncbi:TPA_asm: P2 [Picris trirhavirus 1]|nr:MAG: 40 kDa unknown protein [Picris cytorhabdovirus 1]DBA36570.1 TPA_asm: P2 [Picris trirhavirus 1]